MTTAQLAQIQRFWGDFVLNPKRLYQLAEKEVLLLAAKCIGIEYQAAISMY